MKTIFNAQPEDLCLPCESITLPQERILLYALTLATNPKRVIEIGTRMGGAAWIMDQACAKNGDDYIIVCLDPQLQIKDYSIFSGRVHFLEGHSPADLTEAVRVAGAPFHLAFVDGNHAYESVLADLRGLLPHMAPGGMVICHDAYLYYTQQAIQDSVQRLPYIDRGNLCAFCAGDDNDDLAFGLHVLHVPGASKATVLDRKACWSWSSWNTPPTEQDSPERNEQQCNNWLCSSGECPPDNAFSGAIAYYMQLWADKRRDKKYDSAAQDLDHAIALLQAMKESV